MTWCIFGCGKGGINIATEFWDRIGTGKVCRLDFAEPALKIKAIDHNTEMTKIVEDELNIEGLDGFARKPEALICAKKRKEIGRRIYKEILLEDYIRPNSEQEQERGLNILFTVGLGGGTGTGVINPITQALRGHSGGESNSVESFVGVLGALTEKAEEDKHGAKRNQRCFGAILALYDLLARKEGVDAVFLVDNELIRDKGQNVKYHNEKIFKYFFPMVNPRRVEGDSFRGRELREKFRSRRLDTVPPIMVPCYYETDKKVTDKKEDANAFLTEAFGDDGKKGNIKKLMVCGHKKADKVIVYTSLLPFETLENVKEKIKKWTEDSNKEIEVCRVLDSKQKILVLLRNPYGNGEDDFYERIAGMVEEAGNFAKNEEDIIFENLKRYSAFRGINDRDKKLRSFKNKLLAEFDNMCEKIKSDTNNRPLLEGNKTVEELIAEVI